SHYTNLKIRGSNPTSVYRLILSRLGPPSSIPALEPPTVGMEAGHRKGATTERLDLIISRRVIRKMEHQTIPLHSYDKYKVTQAAQWLEHWSCKPGVGSSILPGGSPLFVSKTVPGALPSSRIRTRGLSDCR
ncbi:hypothetical protein T265_12517, partial [Opisthorchis viverrini]